MIKKLLKTALDINASDLHLISNSKPRVRVDGELIELDSPIILDNEIKDMLFSILDNKKIKIFQDTLELDFTYELEDIGRFRTNYYMQKNCVAASFRVILRDIPSLDELNQPPILKKLIKNRSGLILVTGATGSGKTTTVAALLNEINQTQKKHIITIEDPIEYIYKEKKSIFSQREVGSDTKSFDLALKYALRQDPDIIFVGELRDKESIKTALIAAETGHLVFATLHTNSAVQTISRIINSFDQLEQSMARVQLSTVLKATISQTLIPKKGGGRVCIQEILISNQAISNLIREDKQHQIYAQMQLNRNATGMQIYSDELDKAFRDGIISKESLGEMYE